MTPLNLDVLNTAQYLAGRASSYSIWQNLIGQYGDSLLMIKVHQSLDYLESQGLVVTHSGSPNPERGNRPRRIVYITKKGSDVLALRIP